MRFGHLVVIEPAGKANNGKPTWKCKCDCGKEVIVAVSNLWSGNTKTCGCSRTKFDDLSGRQFGDLTVIERDWSRKGKVYYICKCRCGNYTSSRSDGLLNGVVNSCGCSIESSGTRKIKQILNDANIEYKTEVCFPGLKSPKGVSLRYDFALYNNGELIKLIEFDGRQHFQGIEGWWGGKDAFEYRKECDAIKDKYAESNNIPLLRISYKDEKKLSLEMLLGEKEDNTA